MALFSSAADTFVFSFLIRRFLFREGRSTTEMLPAQEAWRISGEGLFTGVRGRGILRSSDIKGPGYPSGVSRPFFFLSTGNLAHLGDAVASIRWHDAGG